jgi:hypothetical protein
VRIFKLPHALHIGKSFSGFSGISNPHSNLGFGIPLLHHLILLAFPILILRVMELTVKALLVHAFSWIFSCLLVFSQQSSVAQSTTEAEYVAAPPKFYG